LQKEEHEAELQRLQLSHDQEVEDLRARCERYEEKVVYFQGHVVHLVDAYKAKERKVIQLENQVAGLERASREDMQESLRLHSYIKSLEKGRGRGQGRRE
jgi:predicted RNase H-like nuclease (RuvC/YqgF family)